MRSPNFVLHGYSFPLRIESFITPPVVRSHYRMEPCLVPSLHPDTCPWVKPPPGVTAKDPKAPNTKSELVVVVIVCTSLCILAATARVFTKAVLLKSMQIEDCEPIPRPGTCVHHLPIARLFDSCHYRSPSLRLDRNRVICVGLREAPMGHNHH